MAGRSRTPEVDRLHQVYEGYDADESARARWSLDNAGNRAIHAERARRAGVVLSGAVGPVLDLGCGGGQVLVELDRALPTDGLRVGVDLRAARLSVAADAAPGAGFARAEGSALPFPDATFGLVLAFTLFSSILDEAAARAVATELGRVLRPAGRVLWYDLRRPNPSNDAVRPLAPAEIEALFPGWTASLRPLTVLPPLARRLGPATDALYPRLARVRPLTTHLLGTVTKPA
ncbi:MAG: class I SAM-dependent methyltransferase [Acidimicrobiales bacterium]|nr:class I SAM-dependent methyltransferase [Acidimicrobiales bacterium]